MIATSDQHRSLGISRIIRTLITRIGALLGIVGFVATAKLALLVLAPSFSHEPAALTASTASSASHPIPLSAKGHSNAASASTPAPASQFRRAPLDCSGWNIIPSRNPGSDGNTLRAVAALSANDAWAVGWSALIGGISTSLIEHWDGTSWTVVPSPSPGSAYNRLYSVAAISPNDIWAVGNSAAGFGLGYDTLTMHWDGSSWSLVPSPNPGQPHDTSLYDLTPVSSNDIWAVGSYRVTELGRYDPLILHWDGSSWAVVPGPSVTEYRNTLYGVVAVAANDIWAVGSYDTGSANQTLIEHWNGSAWAIIPTPNVGTAFNALSKVTALAPSDIWAVGSYYNSGGPLQTLVEHWNGSAWSVVPSPNPTPGEASLDDIAADPSGALWAVGSYYNSTSGVYETLVERWDGIVWATIASPNPGSDGNHLYGVSALTSTDVWAVGTRFMNSSGPSTLAMRYSEQCGSPTPTPTPAPGCSLAYNIVASANTDPRASHYVMAVSARASNDIWAAGYYNQLAEYGEHTLTMHWNGTQWSIIPSPDAGTGYNYLYGIEAIAPNDVWAVGRSGQYTNQMEPITMHWNGTQWSIVPNNAPPNSVLYGVSAVSPTDVWAVGSSGSGYLSSLVQHWDGVRWSVVPSPSTGDISVLSAISARAADDIWAVGQYVPTGSVTYQTLVEHWDGVQWVIVPSPNRVSGNLLTGVQAFAPNDVWAVGYDNDYNGSRYHRTLTMHWDGTQWSIVSSPNGPGQTDNYLYAVSGVASDDLWAVGYYISVSGQYRTLIEHWDGSSWTIMPSPNPGAELNYLYGVEALAPDNVWAVGDYVDNNVRAYRTLVERYSRSCTGATATPTLTIPATPTATRTSVPVTRTPTAPSVSSPTSTVTTPPTAIRTATATATRTAFSTRSVTPSPIVTSLPPSVTPTSTPTSLTPGATSTVCPIQFSDVPEGSTFYPYVRCLACRGVISGYNDNTFRPGNNVTRGQLSKIVANAAGFNEPVEGQTFRDVPSTHTFYEYIERMARRGIISGYNDGTFRPGNPATRGQICKIVANAAGYREAVSGQTFSDVPLDHTFYEYIERMVRRGIIGGYDDGTFRPQNNATRGQVSKIVANTFFPSCQTPSQDWSETKR